MSPTLVILLSLSACKKDKGGSETGTTDTALPWAEVEVEAEWTLPGLACDVELLRTEADVPHIYAHDRLDLSRVHGFVQARDRYFSMDLARRLGRGRVSELLGADALETDMESRATGMTWVGDHLLETITDEQAAILDAFAEGINAWIAEVKAGNLPLPSELEVAAPILGVADATELLLEWDRADLTGMAAVLVYELGYETGDIGRASTEAQLADLFDGAAYEELRTEGLLTDIWSQVVPVLPSTSSAGWGTETAAAALTTSSPGLRPGKPVPTRLLDRLEARMSRFEDRLGRGDLEAGWGSNVWAVGASVSADGTAMLASDGHLPLSVPSLFWQVGLDTSVLGGGDTHQVGLGIPGLPFMAVGTNGYVAWSQTQLMGDITDWYREEIQLDDDGALSATLFQGEWQPVAGHDESHTIADVPILGSEGGTFSWRRYTTFDGRWIADVEGVEVDDDYVPAAGETVLIMPGTRVVPQDSDGDGVITAISFDYTAFSDGNILSAVDAFGHSESVAEFKEATRYLVAYSQNMAAADRYGSVLYTGYQAVPCRTYLPRDADGMWAAGAHPGRLIDGTLYGGFEIPIGDDGLPLEGEADDYRCLVPFDEYPNAVDPARGYVVNANNDPGSITLDNDLLNEPWYIGGPWVEGFRASRIEGLLDDAIAAGTADADTMAAIQGDHKSALGAWFSWHLVEAIEVGRAASTSDTAKGPTEERLAALYDTDPDAMDEVQTRIEAWAARGWEAESGVTTFYDAPGDDQVEDSIATTLFNAWLGYWAGGVFDDEGLPHVWQPGSTTGKTRALTMFLEGRGKGNPGNLASFNEETGESIFFDVLGTDPVETSDEIALQALIDALSFLRSEPDDDLRGSGFGTEDMSQYRWGMRHQTRFESILGDFLDGDDYAFITDVFAINTGVLPLEGDAESADLEWFPRPGDNLGVDAANPGWGTDFTHSSGPVFRMVIELGPEGLVSGRNVLPGGQSALIDSEYFADQAALWLANDTVPMWLDADDVASHAHARERFIGAGGACD